MASIWCGRAAVAPRLLYRRLMCSSSSSSGGGGGNVPSPTANPPTPAPASTANLGPKQFSMSTSTKYYLVWTGYYKSVDEVPNSVPQDTIERAKWKLRIRFSNMLMALTLVACVIAAISGKRKAERGETVQQMNLDWHKEIDAQYNKEQAQKKST